jgi:hypothetical protein
MQLFSLIENVSYIRVAYNDHENECGIQFNTQPSWGQKKFVKPAVGQNLVYVNPCSFV